MPAPASAEKGADRFFLMGDGNIHIENMRTGKEIKANLLNPDGSLNEEGLTQVDEAFEFTAIEKGDHISPRLIFALDYFSDLVAPGKVIRLDSGYRSPEYNNKLREAGGNVARTSVHMDGMALDFHLDGVNGKALWEIVKSKECCGVGHYGGSSIHLDTTRPRFWEASTSKVRTGESDFNQRIYLSTDFDRYRNGDTVRLSLTSVSDFGFGVKRAVHLVDDPEGNHVVASAQIKTPDEGDCITVRDRAASRLIHVPLPPGLRGGRYRVRVEFCRRPFEQMPLKAVSNEIELVGDAR
jgi:uncharacterized protein YcbK (DUF882 family)